MALAAAGLLAACTASKVDPDARIDIAGSLHRQDGSPAGGVRVALTKEPDVIEALGTVMSLGLACLDEDLPDACGDTRTAGADADGRFRFRLEGRDTQGAVGNASTMELSALLPRRAPQVAGPGVTLRFLVQTPDIMLPLGFWEPAVRATADRRTMSVTWSRVRGDVLPDAASIGDLRFAIRFASGRTDVWTFDRAQAGRPLDTRVLEDTRGSFAVVARADAIPTTERTGSKIDVILRSARYPYTGTAGAPPSRGASCRLERGSRRITLSPCTMTDGDFATELPPGVGCRQGSPCRPARHVVVDLARATVIDAVVVRGCGPGCDISTSNDGRAWRQRATMSSDREDAIVELPGAVRARYVRVSSSGDVAGLREISVWSPTPAGARASLIDGPGRTDPLEPGAGPGDDGGVSIPWPWVALAALGGLGVGVAGMLVARRRRPAA